MGLRRSKADDTLLASAGPGSMVASAVRLGLSDQAWRGYRFTDEAWQKQAWDFYDTNGQLHNSVEYVGSACSLIRIYVAHVDENGVREGEVEDDPEIAALADSLFGGPANKAEMLRGIGESLTVAGELFILGKASRNDLGDQWWTAAPSEVRRNGNTVYVNMGRAQREELNPGRDLIIRCWTPHPRRHYLADSPVRAVLGLLSEMEQMQLFLRAQLTSRIANATILPVPSTLSVPRGDDQSVSNDDIYEQIFEVITSNLEGRGTAAQVAPILWQMPLDELKAMAGIEPIRFDSPLSDQAIQLRAEQQNKLAIAMNVPVEIQVGGQEVNHWSIWWAGEEFITKTIMPLFNRIVDALNTAYLQPALKKLGKDGKRYTYWYDTAPLANSANKLTDTLNLYERGIVSADAVLRAGNYNKADKPTRTEEATRFIKEVVLRDPTLFSIDQVREAINIFIETAIPGGELTTPPPPPPAPERGIEGPQPGQKPTQPAVTDAVTEPADLVASLSAPSAAHIAANGAVLRALEVANKRMLTATSRGAFSDVHATKLHTKLSVSNDKHCETILASVWDNLDAYLEHTGVPAARLQPVLHSYVKGLMLKSIEHSPSLMSAMLKEAGIP